MWACCTAQRSLNFPFTEGLTPANRAAPPPRSGCLTTAAAAQECLSYNVTHISKCESSLLLLCREWVHTVLCVLLVYFSGPDLRLVSLTLPAAVNTNISEEFNTREQRLTNLQPTTGAQRPFNVQDHFISSAVTKPHSEVKILVLIIWSAVLFL